MKKFLAGLILGLMLATSGVALAASAIRVYVDGNEVISDVPAQIIDGRTVLPVRAITEAMGASVSWDEVSNSVYITSKQYIPEPVVAPAPIVAPDMPVGIDMSAPVTSVVYETAPTWQELIRFEGVESVKQETIETEVFHITADEWRIKWSSLSTTADRTSFYVNLHDDKGHIVNNTANSMGSSRDVKYMYGSGDYHFRIGTSHSYTIIIEELK